MTVAQEVASFIEQQLNKYEAVGLTFRGHFLETEIRKNLQDTYLQFKYIIDTFNAGIFHDTYDTDKNTIAYRVGEVLRKIFVSVPQKEMIGTTPSFKWGDYIIELSPDEYIDNILINIGLLIEHYFSLMKNDYLINFLSLARQFQMPQTVIANISKQENIIAVADELANRTTTKYGIPVNPLVNMKQYQVRCAVAHSDFYYERTNPGFKVYLNANRSQEIVDKELITLLCDLLAKLNIVNILASHFSNGNLPLPAKQPSK